MFEVEGLDCLERWLMPERKVILQKWPEREEEREEEQEEEEEREEEMASLNLLLRWSRR